MNSEAQNIDWHDLPFAGPVPGKNAVVSQWLPLFDGAGNPTTLGPNEERGIFVRLTGKYAERLITVTASVTEMSNEADADTWLPKSGAAKIFTRGVSVYAPYGQIRIEAATEYTRPIRIGAMLHLGFCD